MRQKLYLPGLALLAAAGLVWLADPATAVNVNHQRPWSVAFRLPEIDDIHPVRPVRNIGVRGLQASGLRRLLVGNSKRSNKEQQCSGDHEGFHWIFFWQESGLRRRWKTQLFQLRRGPYCSDFWSTRQSIGG